MLKSVVFANRRLASVREHGIGNLFPRMCQHLIPSSRRLVRCVSNDSPVHRKDQQQRCPSRRCAHFVILIATNNARAGMRNCAFTIVSSLIRPPHSSSPPPPPPPPPQHSLSKSASPTILALLITARARASQSRAATAILPVCCSSSGTATSPSLYWPRQRSCRSCRLNA